MKEINYPTWIKTFLTKQEVESISTAVKNAETKTAGEIVPIIVRRSSSIAYIPVLLTCLMLLALFVTNGFYALEHQFQIRFSNVFAYTGAYVCLVVLTAIFYFVSVKLAQIKCVQRLAISTQDKTEQVHERALLEFYLNHVTKTEFKTGIMIFISLMERQAVVLGDEAISKKLPQETWNEIVNTILRGIKEKKTAEGLKSAIQRCGEILTQTFPANQKNPDELQNHLIIKD